VRYDLRGIILVDEPQGIPGRGLSRENSSLFMASRTKSAFLQVHSIIGLAISLVLGLVGLTGAMLSFEDEIVTALNRGVAKIEVRAAPVLGPDALVARVQAVPGAGKVGLIVFSSEPGTAVRMRFARSETGERSSVYVDPYDGRVVSAMQGEGFFATLRNLHRFLLLPGNGNGYGRLDHRRRRTRPVRAADLRDSAALAASYPQLRKRHQDLAETQSDDARTAVSLVAAQRCRHVVAAGLSGDHSHRSLVVVRLVQGQRDLAAVEQARCKCAGNARGKRRRQGG
jgi:hypothetical protein